MERGLQSRWESRPYGVEVARLPQIPSPEGRFWGRQAQNSAEASGSMAAAHARRAKRDQICVPWARISAEWRAYLITAEATDAPDGGGAAASAPGPCRTAQGLCRTAAELPRAAQEP